MGYLSGSIVPATMRFAVITNAQGQRLHVGCVMRAGTDWVEVSLPGHFALEETVWVSFSPCLTRHHVKSDWRTVDRVGLVYLDGGPTEEQFTGIPGLFDLRPACLKRLTATR